MTGNLAPASTEAFGRVPRLQLLDEGLDEELVVVARPPRSRGRMVDSGSINGFAVESDAGAGVLRARGRWRLTPLLCRQLRFSSPRRG